MVSIPKVVGLMSCGFLLCLGLSNAAQAGNAASAADEMKAGQSDNRTGGQAGVKSDQNKLKGQDGKEVGLRNDQTTPKTGNIDQGDRIEAEVNDQNRALSSESAGKNDRRNEKSGSAGDSK